MHIFPGNGQSTWQDKGHVHQQEERKFASDQVLEVMSDFSGLSECSDFIL